MAMLWDDYIKIRHAKNGEKVILSNCEELIKDSRMDGTIGRHINKPSKWSNLDTYDGTYV